MKYVRPARNVLVVRDRVGGQGRRLLLLLLLLAVAVAAPHVVAVGTAVVEPAVDADAVLLLLLHGAVVARLGEAEVVVGDALHPAGRVQLAARAVCAVQVGSDQIWSKALLKNYKFGS